MSDLVKSNNDDLLALAEELNINLDTSATDFYSSVSSKLTNYNKPKNIRAVFDAHKGDENLKWTPLEVDMNAGSREGEFLFIQKEGKSDPSDLGNVVELRGIIVDYQQRDELRYFDGEKTNILCSVLGYNNGDSIVKALPQMPYGLKYTFEQDSSTNKWSVNTSKPNPVVSKLGLVGYRGEKVTSCEECIKCGLSTEVIPGIGDGGSDKKIMCDARGRLFLAVFEVVVKEKVKQENSVKGKAEWVNTLTTYKVKDILNLDNESIGDFVFMEVPMSKSNIQGKYVKNAQGKKDEEATIVGYESFCKNLSYQFKNTRDPLRQSKFHYVSLSWRKATPLAMTSQSHFVSLGAVTADQFRSAHKEWEMLVPVKEIETLELDPLEQIQTDGTINIKATVDDNSYVKNITNAVVEDITDDEIPF